MGSTTSTPETSKPDSVENVKKLFQGNDEKDILETLNISELKIQDDLKPDLPILGGSEDNKDDATSDLDFNLIGGGNSNNDIRFLSKRRRYLRHNIFKILAELENAKSQKGGNMNEEYLSTSSDDQAIQNIKNIILKELHKFNSTTDMPELVGGACGCEGKSEDEQEGGAKRRKAKKSAPAKSTKKSKKYKQKGGESDDEDSSSSSSSSSSDSDEETESSYNSSLNQSSEESEESEESQKGGLSIFPFNSSEIKSSVSEKKNRRMIRRKI